MKLIKYLIGILIFFCSISLTYASPPSITNFQVNPIVSISENNPMTISANVSDEDLDLNSVAIVLVDSNNLISDNQTLFIISVNDSGVSGFYALVDWPAVYFNIANDIISEPVTIFVPETPPTELFVFGSFQKNPTELVQSDCMLSFDINDYTLFGGGCEASGDINPQIENGISKFTVNSMKFVDGLFSEPSEIDGSTFTLYNIGNILNPQLEEALVPSGDYIVMMHIEDEVLNMADEEKNITVDNTAPIITLIGDNPQVIDLGNDYMELGATATDNYDGDISENIVIDSSAVDTSVVGTYDVTYEVTDNAKNPTQVIRTININDIPEVLIISPEDGEVIFNETINGATVSFSGTAIDAEDGNLTAGLKWYDYELLIGNGTGFDYELLIGRHEINARVTDSDGASTKDKHVIYVNTPGNIPPIANAGGDQSVYVNNLVTLDASGSSDPENDTLTYTWIQKEGPFTVSIESEIVNPTFTPSETGTYVFKLMVNDGILDGFDSVSITVLKQPPPSNIGSPSGGGGTPTGGEEEIIISTTSKIVTLKVGSRVVYSLNNKGHSVNLDSVHDDHVTVKVSSDPFNVDLYVGKNVKVDSDGNGIDDLLMRLENLFATSARVTFKVLKEVTVSTIPETKEVMKEVTGSEVTGAVIGPSGKKFPISTIFVLLGLAILLGGGYTLLHIKKPHITGKIHRIPRRMFRKLRRREEL